MASNRSYLGKEFFDCFIGYVNHIDVNIEPLLIKLPKLSRSIKRLNIKFKSFMFSKKHEDILKQKKKYRIELKVLFDLLNDFCSYEFQPKETIFTRYWIILIDSVYKNDKSHYPKVLVEDYKYIAKDKAIKNIQVWIYLILILTENLVLNL